MTHGIIGNNWYNRKKINRFIALMIAIIKISVVTDIYRKQISMNMLVETFADINKLSNNHTSKTISVGIKDRGSILMAEYMRMQRIGIMEKKKRNGFQAHIIWKICPNGLRNLITKII